MARLRVKNSLESSALICAVRHVRQHPWLLSRPLLSVLRNRVKYAAQVDAK